MNKHQFKLPGTVGPWFTYWIEYIPEAQLGADLKKWFRASIQKVLTRNPFGRKVLSNVSNSDLVSFLNDSVYSNFNKEESALLRAYFESAMVAAKNLGGAEGYSVKLPKIRRPVRNALLGIVALATAVIVFFAVLALDRIVNKREDTLTASATVLRESGLGFAVAFAEDLYYNYIRPPKVGGEPTTGPNSDDSDETAKLNEMQDATVANNPLWGVARTPSVVPVRLVSPVSPLAGEGEWKPTKIQVNGNTAIWIARIRPDKVHTSYWATVTWLDPKLLAFAQVPGTKIPEVSGLTNRTGRVPTKLKPFYVAGLNGGFLMKDSQGGYAFGGKTYQRMVKGKASLVTYKDGSFDVVQWGRDSVKSGVQSIRQNMELIVDGGENQVEKEDQSKWGWVWKGVGSGKNLVWRSAIGVRSDGTMVYVIGSSMSAKSLGDVLVRAGAQRAILLDMNEAFANGFLYGPYKGGKKIDSATTRSPERFWLSSERDFIAVYAKSPASRDD